MRRALANLSVLFVLSVLSFFAVAQQSMTVDELQQYINEQKEALAQVEANRAETAKKAAEVKAALMEQEARRAEVEAEFKALCEEQDKIKPGSMDDCLAELNQ